MAGILLRPLLARAVGSLAKRAAAREGPSGVLTSNGKLPVELPSLVSSGIFLSCCGVHTNNEPDQATLRSRFYYNSFHNLAHKILLTPVIRIVHVHKCPIDLP